MIRFLKRGVLAFFVTLSFLNYYENKEVGLQYAYPILSCLLISLVAASAWTIVDFIVEGIFGSPSQRADGRPQPRPGDRTQVISTRMDPNYIPPSTSLNPNATVGSVTLIYHPQPTHHCGPNSHGYWNNYWGDRPGTIRECTICGRSWEAYRPEPSLGYMGVLWRREGWLSRRKRASERVHPSQDLPTLLSNPSTNSPATLPPNPQSTDPTATMILPRVPPGRAPGTPD